VKVSELGEFGLIARLTDELSVQTAAADGLWLGIGDDAAVWGSAGGAHIATTDTMVADVHFPAGSVSWRDLGWKALATNVSDIAAMGGTPEYALVTLALPGDFLVEAVLDLYEGLVEAGEAYGVTVAGGDVVRSPVFVVTVALSGRAELDEAGRPVVLRRDAASAGDLVTVTGALGGSAGGLLVLTGGADAEGEARERLVDAHMRPQARLDVGRAALAAGVRCAIDLSDGLLQDLGHVCEAGGLGASVWAEKVPVSPWLYQVVPSEEALRLAVSGGEDYELLFIGSEEQVESVRRQVALPVTVVGEMVVDPQRRVQLLDEAGRSMELAAMGWDHFAGQRGR
jgi:thiamine-monophosphate kinase